MSSWVVPSCSIVYNGCFLSSALHEFVMLSAVAMSYSVCSFSSSVSFRDRCLTMAPPPVFVSRSAAWSVVVCAMRRAFKSAALVDWSPHRTV